MPARPERSPSAELTSAPSYLAIDLGASSGRAVLGTLQHGRMGLRDVRRFPSHMIEQGGHLYWDVAALWQEVQRGVEDALRLAPGLRSLSVDSWAVDYVSLDAGGSPLRPPYAYRDPRTRGRLPELFRRVPAEEIYARTGIQFLEFNTLPQLMVELDEEPGQARRAALRLLVADYFLYRLSGRAVAERTMASTTQLMDVRSGEWSEPLLQAIGDDAARWPPIVPPATVLGELLQAPAGAHRPLVVATCSHDTAAAVAAVPASGDAPWAYISSGTWSLVGAELDAPLLTPEARRAGFTNEAGLDGTIRFLKNRTGMWVLEECIREWGERGEAGERPGYEALLAEAAAAPPCAGTLDLEAPEFGQRGGMVPRLERACRAAGLLVPRERGALVRLILESLAHSYRRTLAELEALTGVRVEVVHVVGGGARNHLLNQLTADACGRRVLAGPEEATALGNLLVQARALGDLPAGSSVREAARLSATIHEYSPGRPWPGRATALATPLKSRGNE